MPFSFVQITDHHLRETEATLTRGYSPAYALRKVLKHIASNHADVDFIVSTGDLVELGTDAEYQFARGLLGLRGTSTAPGPQTADFEGATGISFYLLPGNHDPRDVFFRNMFPIASGAQNDAMNVSFTHKGVQFICIDWGNSNKAVSSPAMLDHLSRCLASPLPSVILSHHNVTPMGIAHIDAQVADDIERFASIVRGKRILGLLAGHTHATYASSIAGTPVFGLRSTCFSFAQEGDKLCYVLRPPHYRVVTIDEDALRSEIVEVDL